MTIISTILSLCADFDLKGRVILPPVHDDESSLCDEQSDASNGVLAYQDILLLLL